MSAPARRRAGRRLRLPRDRAHEPAQDPPSRRHRRRRACRRRPVGTRPPAAARRGGGVARRRDRHGRARARTWHVHGPSFRWLRRRCSPRASPGRRRRRRGLARTRRADASGRRRRRARDAAGRARRAAVSLCARGARLGRPRREPDGARSGQRAGVRRGRGRRHPRSLVRRPWRDRDRRYPQRGRRALLPRRRDGEEPAMARLARDMASSAMADWIRRSAPEDLLSVDIFFDLRPVHGDGALANSAVAGGLRARARRDSGLPSSSPKRPAPTEPGLNLLGGIRTRQGRIDLKKAGLFGIVTLARVLAIRHHVVERATPARIAGVKALDTRGRAGSRRPDRGAGRVPGSDPRSTDRRHRTTEFPPPTRSWSSA